MIAIMEEKFTNIFCTSILDKKIFLITAMKSLGWWWLVYLDYNVSFVLSLRLDQDQELENLIIKLIAIRGWVFL